MATLTIQPSNIDTYLDDENPTSNSGSSTQLIITNQSANHIRAILKFDFSSLPDGVTIDSATLSIYIYQDLGAAAGRTLSANRMTELGWVEGEATWNEYSSGNSWSSAGGDFTSTDAATQTIPAAGNWVDFDVKVLAEYFRDNDSEIANFLIKDDGSEVSLALGRYYSSEYSGDTSLRPKLIIDYHLPNDAAITFPLLSVQGGSGATGVISLPILSVQGFGAAGAEITLPQLSLSAFSSPGISNITLPIFTTSLAGHLQVDGTVTLPLISLNAISSAHADGTVTLPAFSLSSTGLLHGASSLALPVASLDALASGDDDISITLPALTLSATGNPLRGVAQITLSRFDTNLTGFSGSTDGTALELPAFTISIRTGLTVSTLLPQFTLAATAQSGFVGTYNKSLPRMTVNVKATQQSRGINSITLPVFTLDASLKTGEISLASTRNLPGLRLGATGFVGVPGDVDLTFPAFELSVFGYQGLQGTVVQSLKMLTLDAYADVYTNRII